MRLHVAAGLPRQPPESPQQLIGAGWNEAWRDHGQNQAALVAGHRSHIADEAPGLGLGDAGVGISIVGGTLVGIIHRDAADQGALRPPQANIGKRLSGRQMNGPEIHCGGRAVRKQCVDQGFINPPRIVGVADSAPRAETCKPAAILREEGRAPNRAAATEARGHADRRDRGASTRSSPSVTRLPAARWRAATAAACGVSSAMNRLDSARVVHLDQSAGKVLDPAACRVCAVRCREMLAARGVPRTFR